MSDTQAQRNEDFLTKLARIYGPEFAEKYRKKIMESKRLSQETLRKIKELSKQLLPQRDDFMFVYTDNNQRSYDVLLVQVPNNPVLKKTSTGNYRIGVLWYGASGVTGPWVSAFFDQEQEDEAKLLESHPNDFFLLVGRLKEKEINGKPTLSMNVVAVIPLEEEDMTYELPGETKQEEQREGAEVEEEIDVEAGGDGEEGD